jgi:hypothetical protein
MWDRTVRKAEDLETKSRHPTRPTNKLCSKGPTSKIWWFLVQRVRFPLLINPKKKLRKKKSTSKSWIRSSKNFNPQSMSRNTKRTASLTILVAAPPKKIEKPVKTVKNNIKWTAKLLVQKIFVTPVTTWNDSNFFIVVKIEKVLIEIIILSKNLITIQIIEDLRIIIIQIIIKTKIF